MRPISLDNINIMQDFIAEKENFLNKNDLVLIYGCLIMEKLFLIKMTKLLFHQMKISGKKLVFLENLKMLIVLINDFVLVCVYLKMIWI